MSELLMATDDTAQIKEIKKSTWLFPQKWGQTELWCSRKLDLFILLRCSDRKRSMKND